MISIKNPDQLAKMRSAGHLLHDVLCRLREAIQPGVTTKALDAYAEEMIRAHGAIPSFLNYHGYPASICASILPIMSRWKTACCFPSTAA